MLSNTHFMKPFKLIILAGFLFAIVAVTGLAQGTSPKSKNQKSETNVESTKEKVESDESRKGPSSTGLKRLSDLSKWDNDEDRGDIDIDIDEDALKANIEASVERALESIKPVFENLRIDLEGIEIEPREIEIDMEELKMDMDIDMDFDDIDVDHDWDDDGDEELWNDQDEKDNAKNKEKDKVKDKSDKEKSGKEKDRSKGLKKIKGN